MFGNIMKVAVIALVIVLSGCDRSQRTVEQSAQTHLPPEARIIEILGSQWQQEWVVYDLRGECFMMYDGHRRNSMVPVDCSRYGKYK